MAATTADVNSNVIGAEKSTTMITLISSDGEHFDVTEEVAGMSQTIAHMIEDDCVEHGVPLPNVNSGILAKVIEYCNKHVSKTTNPDNYTTNYGAATGEQADLKKFDADFIKVDLPTLYEIILAANYLEIKGLLDLGCQTIADMMKGKTPEELRETFNIANDFTPEEEAAIRKETAWAFE